MYLSERYFSSAVNDATCRNSDTKFDRMVFPIMDTEALQPVMAGARLNRMSGRARYLDARQSALTLSFAGRENWA